MSCYHCTTSVTHEQTITLMGHLFCFGVENCDQLRLHYQHKILTNLHCLERHFSVLSEESVSFFHCTTGIEQLQTFIILKRHPFVLGEKIVNCSGCTTNIKHLQTFIAFRDTFLFWGGKIVRFFHCTTSIKQLQTFIALKRYPFVLG